MHSVTISSGFLLFSMLMMLTSGCSDGSPDPDASTTSALYEDVTTTHLPPDVLTGFSMDARLADLDDDGHLDVVVACEFCPNILLLNDGTGRFADASDRLPRTEHDSEDVGIADFDADGDLDIVLVSEDDQVNELYLNDGAGTFTDASDRLPVTGVSNAGLVADVNTDGAPDILIGNNGQNVILINDGTGRFLDETAARLPLREDVTQDLELGDVDGDGDLDLLVGNEDANRLLLNDGSGTFTDAPDGALPIPDAPEETREADFGDVDRDGDIDILFANVSLFVNGAIEQNRLLINDGTGRFTDVTAQRLPVDQDQTFDGDFIDVDNDGDLDIVTSNADDLRGRRAEGPFRVYLNDGQGDFTDGTAEVFPASALGNGFDVEAADVNGDGRLDLYLASRGGTDRLLLASAE